ncbi:uncharacterized protein LOC118181000 [Stegodyphus dumicola]|uniref:uncharacterized protein LOC118181000 n=1 Tax=Stegodyphus dumicola TaxID=202533 RepID=UPI0015A9EC8F|nr:uncharacterized protein LOC118181000 [Stegodyphus dumicola]
MQGRKTRHLLSIQRQFALNITQAYRTTATSALNVLAGLVPLHISTEREAVFQQVKQLRTPATLEDIAYWPDDYEKSINILERHPATQGDNCDTVKVTLRQQIERMQMHTTYYYTDGSKMDDNVGCALVAFRNHQEISHWKGHLHGNNSVFQGEALAIHKAVKQIAEQKLYNTIIVSDSMSALQAIENTMHTSALIHDIQSLLRDTIHLNTRLAWTKAHAGNIGNEKADLLAKDAALNKEAEALTVPWPHSTLKRKLHLQAQSVWQAEWDAAHTGRRTHCHLLYVNPARLYSNPHMVRYITGHGTISGVLCEARYRQNRPLQLRPPRYSGTLRHRVSNYKRTAYPYSH